MRVNREIRARELRVISATGEQLGIMSFSQAYHLAEEAGLDLVEIVSTSTPPVAKIIDYGKFRYDQTKREKESKKSQHQIKVKEVKVNLNIDDHDLEFKLRHARTFLEEGNKVKLTVAFRGREMSHPELGHRLMEKMLASLQEVAVVETPSKFFGRFLTANLASCAKKRPAVQSIANPIPKGEPAHA